MDFDLSANTVRVVNTYGDEKGRGLVLGPPKSRAGRRTVSFPAAIAPAIEKHLSDYVPDSSDALVFTGSSTKRPPLRRNNFAKLVKWRTAIANVGVAELHFHDLRHTGNTLAAKTGTSTRDLMTRMGHDSTRAALIYQHATAQADKAIAEALDRAVREMNGDGQDDDEGTAGVPAKAT